jgi:hypothetical protein
VSDARPARPLADLLVEAEQQLAARDPAHGESRGPDGTAREACEALEAAIARAAAAEVAPLAARIRHVRALQALRSREVPAGRLEGIYEAVHARTADTDGRAGAWLRAGMTDGFLDAPRALRFWRRTAVAACALVAFGAGMFATEPERAHGPAAPVGAVRALHDPRDDLLLRSERGVPGTTERAAKSPIRAVFDTRPARRGDAGRMLDALRVVPLRGALVGGALERN